MSKRSRQRAKVVACAFMACCALATTFAPIAQADETISFSESYKGSTLKITHSFEAGFFSPGDEAVGAFKLKRNGKRYGTDRFACTATSKGGTDYAGFRNAHFICQGIFSFGSLGTLTATYLFGQPKTEGPITGGTGKYAGARGTFVSTEGKTSSKVTINLVG